MSFLFVCCCMCVFVLSVFVSFVCARVFLVCCKVCLCMCVLSFGVVCLCLFVFCCKVLRVLASLFVFLSMSFILFVLSGVVVVLCFC